MNLTLVAGGQGISIGDESVGSVESSAISDMTSCGIKVFNGGSLHVSHSNIWNNGTDYCDLADATGIDGNISVDPEYLDTTPSDPMDWDLHLASSSPLVDAGDPSSLDPDGSLADIGACGGENAAEWDLDWDGYMEWWMPGPYDDATYPALDWDCDDSDDEVYPGSGC